ncbi:hypothetical protein PhCBS80983_g01317 [Powellomyces hirtus]|uniref:RING-type domain-containing protein n=1 Tax=Powellomyces hirtus TaxID=109895 RepID=A0A507EAS8_9FUNG|nr:hypothetical protein PhCBS80983_g01317 [Powellomyces hirtus]
MKFAKQYSEVYRGLPPTWPAFQYKALKKTIGKVVKELEEQGIFALSGADESGKKQQCHVEYFLEGTPGNLEPCVIIHVLKDNPTPASLQDLIEHDGGDDDYEEKPPNSDTRGSPTETMQITISPSHRPVSHKEAEALDDVKLPDSLVLDVPLNLDTLMNAENVQPSTSGHSTLPSSQSRQRVTINSYPYCCSSSPSSSHPTETVVAGGKNMVKVFLKTDQQFFSELATAVNDIAEFETNLQDAFRDNLDILSKYLTNAASPYSKDMYAWRRLLSVYLQSEIWLVNGVKDRSLLSSKQQLETFDKIARENLRPTLKSRTSATALESFLELNREMLDVKQFDEINHTAVRKILKKHDKRTQLAAGPEYTRFSDTQSFFVDNVARALIFAVQERLTLVVPQPEDYACPICQEISWKPIRLVCGHVFCVRCLVKAQVRRVQHCPICRSDGAVEKATPDQLDVARMNLLKLYFPKETKQKARDSGQERAAEDMQALFGNSLAPHSPSINIPQRDPFASLTTATASTSPPASSVASSPPRHGGCSIM